MENMNPLSFLPHFIYKQDYSFKSLVVCSSLSMAVLFIHQLFTFIFLFLFFPQLSFSYCPTNMSCNPNIEIYYPFKHDAGCNGSYLIQCIGQLPTIQLHNKGGTIDYTVKNISYDDRTITIQPQSFNIYGDSSCSYLYNFTNPIPHVDLPHPLIVEGFDASTMSSCKWGKNDFPILRDNYSYSACKDFNFYYSTNSKLGLSSVCRAPEAPLLEYRLSFAQVDDKGLSLLLAGFSNSLELDPGCFQENICNNESRNLKTVVLAASLGGTTAFVAACCVALCYYKRREKMQQLVLLFQSTSQISSLHTHNTNVPKNKDLNIGQNIEGFLEKYGSLSPKRYKYSDIKRITKSFRHKLGRGAYGSVFRGTLSDGRAVAVKVLSNSKGNGDDFVNEIASIGRSSHVNVVSLVGFCSEGTKRALLYEYMCNGSLDKLICEEKQKATPDWGKLYRIAAGIARGLEYLHRGCNTRIVHFDIKPHNILLDKDFCPKISDFGLAMLCHRKDSILSMEGMRGTMGYIAPEVFSRNFGVVSSKSDIYSYGMMMLEMAGGRKNLQGSVQSNSDNYFPSWIYKHLEQDEDLQVYGANYETEEGVRKMLLIGLWCIQTLPQNRPPITKVIEMLEGSINDLHLPPKPCLSLPSPLGSLTDVAPVHDSCCSSCSSEVP